MWKRRSDTGGQRWTRRELLRSTTVGGGVALAGCQDSPGTDDRRSRTRTAATPTALRLRIRAHRTTGLGVRVLDGDGAPVEGAEVSVSMRRHDFRFGTAVDASHLVAETSPADPYRERLLELFNAGVVQHRNKWKPWENDSERAMAIRASEWLRDRGLDLRGHAAMWQRFDQPVVPDDVVAKVESDDEDRAAYVSRRGRNHVAEVVGHYEGTIAAWDVLNEQLDAHRLTDVIDPDASSLRPPEVLRWFEIARVADPGATRYINDFGVVTGDRDQRVDDYEELVRFLLDRDAGLEGVGVQAHHGSPDDARPPAALLERLDRFARHGVVLEVTEYDTYGEGWTEERAADHLRTFLETVFSHPAVEGFVMWGFWDGLHWQDDAPLFREDWSPKPAYDVYRSLVFDEWWTDEYGRTDADGEFWTGAFLGEHEVIVTANGASRTKRVSVANPETPTVMDIRLSPE